MLTRLQITTIISIYIRSIEIQRIHPKSKTINLLENLEIKKDIETKKKTNN